MRNNKKIQNPSNSCGKRGCFIKLRVLPFGDMDRRKYRRQIERTVKAIQQLQKAA